MDSFTIFFPIPQDSLERDGTWVESKGRHLAKGLNPSFTNRQPYYQPNVKKQQWDIMSTAMFCVAEMSAEVSMLTS